MNLVTFWPILNPVQTLVSNAFTRILQLEDLKCGNDRQFMVMIVDHVRDSGEKFNTEINKQSRQRSEEAVASLASMVVTPLADQ